MPKVFISHSWEDNEIARKIAGRLKNDGVTIWVDYEDLSGGDSLPDKICEALEWCDVLLLIWSRSAIGSYYVGLEWKSALDLQKKIIPCVLDGSKLPAILRSFLYIDFRNFEHGYSRLLKALDGNVPVWEVPKPRINLRSTPKPLSEDEVKLMLKKHNFFDKSRNENATGFPNEFELQKNGQVVYDRASGLMWQQGGSSESITYEKAKEYIAQLNRDGFAGFTDWRLPTLEEAMSLIEPKEMNGDLFIDPIFDKSQRYIWTADPAKGESRAWVVYFGDGRCLYFLFGYVSVRGVRSGQSSGGH